MDANQNKDRTDIEKLQKILKAKGHFKVSDLLRGSYSFLNESGTYGSRWFSTLSSFEIYSPLKEYEQLNKLSQTEKTEMLNCVLAIYPLREKSPEVTCIEFFPDVDLMTGEEFVDANELNKLSFEYISDQLAKCKDKIGNEDYAGAVTNARTLIESTCLYILHELNIEYESKGNLTDMYKRVAKELKMEASLYNDENLKKIISGSISIIDGIAGLRNAYSDSHGSSPAKNYRIEKRHAVLIVNLAKTVSEFLVGSWQSKREVPF